MILAEGANKSGPHSALPRGELSGRAQFYSPPIGFFLEAGQDLDGALRLHLHKIATCAPFRTAVAGSSEKDG